MRRWLAAAARLYPKPWRDRYGAELNCLLDDVDPRSTDVMDLLRGALTMRVRALSSYLKLVGVIAGAGVVAALVMSFILPGEYVSSAIVRAGRTDDPRTCDRIDEAWKTVTSRSSLSELIQRPAIGGLYQDERTRKPLEDVIEDMKSRGLKLEILNNQGISSYRVSFVYPDRFKAQAVVDAVTKKIMEVNGLQSIAVTANLPEAPVKPDRIVFMAWGLVLGLFAGTLASFLRWRARWTMKVAAFGLSGCVIAASLSLLIPNQYTSHSTLRILPGPAADGSERFMKEAELAKWLAKKEQQILSDESLSEIIHRRSIDLYPRQREDKPIESVIATMRQHLKVDAPHSHAFFTISFTYPDRFKAQQVVSALVTKFSDSEFVISEADLMAYIPPQRKTIRTMDACIGKTGDSYIDCVTADLVNVPLAADAPRQRKSAESLDLLDPATLPETPVAPNRFLLASAGLFAGLFLGAYTQRKKPASSLIAVS